MGFAVREIDFLVELVILAVNANHLQEIHIGGTMCIRDSHIPRILHLRGLRHW